MKVRFFVQAYESDEYEFPDEVSDYELEQMAFEWLDDNVYAEYEIIEDSKTQCDEMY